MSSSSTTAAAGEAMTAETIATVAKFFNDVGKPDLILPPADGKHFICDLIGGLLKPDRVERGHVSCLLRVLPAATNAYKGMHGAAVASVAEMISVACARTVVSEDKELFLGELSMSYLSAAPINAELKVDASIIRSGRNLTVVAVEFRLKDSGNLTYTSRATLYTMPISSL